ncbi:MAG: ATP-binding protein, partial [Bacteroidales bacterium]|nr:ATP-binding protein [Bacteroidales bacterium]
MKSFNVTGTCFPSLHYMVDITKQVNDAIDLVSRNLYFCINRGRQYGKTTTLEAVKNKLEEQGYTVFFISFEGLDDENLQSPSTLYATFVQLLAYSIQLGKVKNIEKEIVDIILNYAEKDTIPTIQFLLFISQINKGNKTVLIIDEVDRASNHDSFIRFLGVIRSLFLDRMSVPTFYSVILAGVYDITNLKLKIRSNEEHSYNSPWNIASDYSSDMS